MYEVRFDKKAADYLDKLDKHLRDRISKKIDKLKQNPELGKPLTSNLAGLWSLRIGGYRALYQIRNNELIILVIKIGLRKGIY